MKKIPKPEEPKLEKKLLEIGKRKRRARRALYKAIQDRLSGMRRSLRLLYVDNNRAEHETDLIHGVIKGIYNTEHIFFELLFDETPPGEVLKNITG